METSITNLNKYGVNNNYTTLEQSEKLLELGLSPETADMYYFCDPTPAGNVMIPTLIIIEKHLHSRLPEYNKGDVPCWSVGALMGLLRPFNCHLTQDIKGNYVISTSFNAWVGYDLLDTLVNTIIWLLQNNYIKTEKK